jgi:hypothetical protein
VVVALMRRLAGKRITRFCLPLLTAYRRNLIVGSSTFWRLAIATTASQHVSIPRGQARHWMLRQHPQYSRPHQAEGVHAERARAVCAQLLRTINCPRLMRPQTSPPLHHPQHDIPAASPRAGPAPAHADALLHALHAGQEQVHNGRQGPRCLQRLQTGPSA